MIKVLLDNAGRERGSGCDPGFHQLRLGSFHLARSFSANSASAFAKSTSLLAKGVYS
jgi:hypothetical protein